MERNEYDTTIDLLGIKCGITVVYLVGTNDTVYIDKVYGPSGKDIYEQLASPALGPDPSLAMLQTYSLGLGMIPRKLRWCGVTEIQKLYDEVLYAHRSGR